MLNACKSDKNFGFYGVFPVDFSVFFILAIMVSNIVEKVSLFLDDFYLFCTKNMTNQIFL
jgi:hypothetical protein